jgi:L-alanine-DL-glutamate epimerase-like enolase superfamily enzyme
MRIERIEAWPLELKLATPYTIAGASFDRTTNVLLRLVTDGPLVGLGCAAPDPAVTGETPSAALDFIQTAAGDALRRRDPLRPVRLLERLRPRRKSHPAALAAVDMALLDLLAKRAGLPAYRLLGAYRDRFATSITIGICDPDEAVRAARRHARRGFTAIKLKGGRDVAADIERVLRVRRAVGPRLGLRFDANQGYDAEQTLAFVAATRAARLELLEQPTPSSQPELLGRLTRQLPLPVMADESLCGLGDAYRLARRERVDMINIKLMKVGGIAEAMQIDAVARAAELESMVGCMDECALAIAAGLAFALARPNVIYADLDGHLDLIGDPSAAAVRLERGRLRPRPAPGLGLADIF